MELQLTQTAMVIFGGVAVSLLVQFLKKRWKLTTKGTMLVVVGLSLIGGAAYQSLMYFGYWDTFLKIIMSAGAFYTFIIKNLPGTEK